MQVLANALPGFRELRAPAIAGYIWLVFAWLLVKPDLSHRPAAEISGSVYDLVHHVGPIWTAIAIGVAAYFVGSVSQELSGVLRMLWTEATTGTAIGVGFEVRADSQLPEIELQAERLIAISRLNSEIAQDLQGALHAHAREARIEGERELDLPATLLVGEQPELFAEVDRLRAEAELRLAVVPPLIAVTILLTVAGSYWWLLLLPAISVLFVQGIQRDIDSKKSIADAIRMGRVPASSVSKFSQWVSEDLTKSISEAAKLGDENLADRVRPTI